MKKLLSALLAAMLLTSAAEAVDLYVDTAKIAADTPPVVIHDTMLVPVRAIFEAVGATVTWDNNTRTAIGIKDGTTVLMQIDNPTAYLNGQPHTLDVPAQLIHGRTMVPARLAAEAMGRELTPCSKCVLTVQEAEPVPQMESAVYFETMPQEIAELLAGIGQPYPPQDMEDAAAAMPMPMWLWE